MALFKFGDLVAKLVAIAPLHFGLAPNLLVLSFGEWRFTHQRTQPSVVGFAFDLDDGLFGDRKIGAEAAEPAPDVFQPLLDARPSHSPRIRRGPRSQRCLMRANL